MSNVGGIHATTLVNLPPFLFFKITDLCSGIWIDFLVQQPEPKWGKMDYDKAKKSPNPVFAAAIILHSIWETIST